MITPFRTHPLAALVHALLLVLLALIPLAAASAQESPNRVLLEDARTLPLNAPTHTLHNDARTLALNPANIALVEHLNLNYAFAVSENLSEGHGLYLVSPLFRGVAAGFGVDWVRVPDTDNFARHFRLGLGFKLANRIALGARVNFFDSDDRAITAFQSLDLGLTFRLVDSLALSFSVDHLNTPRLANRSLDPRLTAGIGWAPFQQALQLDASYRMPTRDSDETGTLQGTLAVIPTDGLRVFGQVTAGDDPLRWGGGVETSWAFATLSVGAFARDNNDAVDFDGVATALTLTTPSPPSIVPRRQRWVVFNMPGRLDERSPRSLFGKPVGPSFGRLLLRFETLARDPSIDGVVLQLQGVAFGYGQLYELREAIEALRASGKRVVVHTRAINTSSYYLATAAEKIYVAPGRNFSARGLGLTLNYYNTSLLALGVQPQFEKIDRYKSAPETYLRDEPSDESREQLNEYLDHIFDAVLESMVAGRGLTREEAQAAIDEAPLSVVDARQRGLVDAIIYRDQLAEQIQKDLELPAPPRLATSYTPPAQRADGWDLDPRVAVIYIDGPIVSGKNIETPFLGSVATGADSIEASFKAALADKKVVAIILRVDSPGGSATASDLMYRAIDRATASKPVIVSMSNVAASGGYYVAAAGDEIFATPLTLTGSIGIYYGKFDISALLRRFGVGITFFLRGANADIYSLYKSWDKRQRDTIQRSIRYLYDVFIERVADGRKLDPDLVRAVAGGRVWTGSRALDHGLVDKEGGFLTALTFAKQRGGLNPDDRVRVVELPPRDPLSLLQLDLPTLPFLHADVDPALQPSPGTVDDVLARFRDQMGGLPDMLLFSNDEPLMMLPFSMVFD